MWMFLLTVMLNPGLPQVTLPIWVTGFSTSAECENVRGKLVIPTALGYSTLTCQYVASP